MIFCNIDPRRFEALAGYVRHPNITLISEEIAWFSDRDERLLGILVADFIDHDFGWVVFARDAVNRYRAIKVNTSYPTPQEAEDALFDAMRSAHAETDESFHQGDEDGHSIDFFAPLIPIERRNKSFELLRKEERFSPARKIIEAMMLYHDDIDGYFVENFQTSGFDARLWELYLWAVFTELGFTRDCEAHVPDFILQSVRGRIAIEATSVNPSENPLEMPKSTAEARVYIENYAQIRLAKTLRKKLNHKPKYWSDPKLEGVPFCLAVQDFHAHMSMQRIVHAVTEYAFGVRHTMVDGKVHVEKIGVHRFGKLKAKSGFFDLPESENVSAIIVNPQGTLPKFNRLGFIANFGANDVRMIKRGMQRNDGKKSKPMPTPFVQEVDRDFDETWVEGMVVLHNPNAKIPLDPNLIQGAAHEFLQDDGRIMSLLPEFHPLFSETVFIEVEPTSQSKARED